MPINMNCPSCGKNLSAPDSSSGKRAKCPACGQIMVVPEAVHDAEEFGAGAATVHPISLQPSAGSPENWLDEMQGPAAAPPAPGAGRRGTAAVPRMRRDDCGRSGKMPLLWRSFRPSSENRSGKLADLKTVPSYLVQAILVTLFCCLPFGIVAIVYAAQVNASVQAGNIRAAQSASDSAKMWCWLSFGLGFAAVALYVVFGILGAAMGH